jgi:outer membrane protein assembly factor BamB
MRGIATSAAQRTALAVTALAGVALLAGLASSGSAAAASPAATASGPVPVTVADWPGYLYGAQHTSYSPGQKAIKPGNVRALAIEWHVPGGYLASPTVADGAVFIGSTSGWFYKINLNTGAIEHKVFLGYRPQNTCLGTGIVATATVAPEPRTRQLIVYVAAANGYLYAFHASNLSLKWKSVIARPSATVADYYDWSSPTVANGRIYIGVSSNCDTPLVRGGLIAFRQTTGRKLAELFTVPRGNVGGSIWSSVAVSADGTEYATTGNGPASDELLGLSDSILKLAPGTLRLLASWQIPAAQSIGDGDFGASPVIFGPYIGACNKNGIFYALWRSTMRLAWQARIGAEAVNFSAAECLAAPVYNGKYLYFGGTSVRVRDKNYRGSIQERLASTGRLIWETGLPNGVIGSPSLDGGGVLAVGTFDNSGVPNQTYLVDAATGRILRALARVRGFAFAQSVFAHSMLFTANFRGVYAWKIKPTG